MRDNAILWVIVLTLLVALGIAGVIAFEYIEEIVADHFVI